MQQHVYQATIANTGTSFPVEAGERILAAARRAGIWLPFECGWGSCGTCKLGVVEGEVETLFPEAPAISERDGRRRRVLACQATPRSDIVVKPSRVDEQPQAGYATSDYVGRLAAVQQLGPDIGRFQFYLDRAACFVEGQHAILDVSPGIRRCYSMSNLSGSPVVEFIAKRYPGGVGSEFLFSLELGARIPIELPYGGMWLKRSFRPASLIAGGTGIAPMLAILRSMVLCEDSRDVDVFYGGGSRAELVCWEELESLVGLLPGGRLHGTVVQEDGGWTGTKGFVTDTLVQQFDRVSECEFYVAGPPPMVNATLDLLRSYEIALDRIHYDAFG